MLVTKMATPTMSPIYYCFRDESPKQQRAEAVADFSLLTVGKIGKQKSLPDRGRHIIGSICILFSG